MSRHPALARAIVLLLVLAPLPIAFLYVRTFSVDVPFWDQWELPLSLAKVADHSFTLQDAFARHNEHRVFFARLAMIALAEWTAYDTRAECWVGLVFLFASWAVLLWDHLQTLGRETLGWLSFVPISWLVLSLRQSENLLWGWQLQIYLCQLGAIVAMVSLVRGHRSRLAFALAIAGSVLASYSFAAGLALWPAGAVYLGYRLRRPLPDAKASEARQLVVWLAAGVATIAGYFSGYGHPNGPAPLSEFMGRPWQALHLFIFSLGGSLTRTPDSGIVTGILVLVVGAVLVVAVWWRLTSEATLGLAIPFACWALLNAAALAVGRVAFGENYGLTSRYTTVMVLGVLAAYRGLLSLRTGAFTRWLVPALGAMLWVLAISSSYAEGLRTGPFERAKRGEMRARLLSFESRTDEELAMLYVSGPAVRERATWLKAHRMSVFRR